MIKLNREKSVVWDSLYNSTYMSVLNSVKNSVASSFWSAIEDRVWVPVKVSVVFDIRCFILESVNK